jgi:hypothetical protein
MSNIFDLRNCLTSSKFFFIINAFYYFIQLATFFYISSKALPQDIGSSSYVISIAGIFAVIARYGMPVYLVESFEKDNEGLLSKFRENLSFSITFSLILIPLSIFVILLLEINPELRALLLFCTPLMIILNPLSMLLEQLFILRKNTSYLSTNCMLKIFIFPIFAASTYLITTSYAWALVVANISILVSPIAVAFKFDKLSLIQVIKITKLKLFFQSLLKASSYFFNSLALILIFSLDKIFVANIFSIDTLGSYDLMWKLAIVADIVLIQPINALYSKDILQISIARASFISILISFAAVFLVMIINFLNFNFLIFAWEVIFPQYELNQEILKISISFFIIMFAVNQLRNIMANRKLRLSLALSSAIIPLPLIAGFFFLQIDSLDLIPLLLIVGASLALIFNFITIINLRA